MKTIATKILNRLRASILALLILMVGTFSPAYVNAVEAAAEYDEIDVLIEGLLRNRYPMLMQDMLVDRVIDNGKQYLGRPYKFLNPQGNIMDCSGFMQYIYSLEGIKLPRTSRQQSAFCTQVSTSDIRKGDLLFFSGSSSKSKTVGHVSMVIDVNGGTLKMMHSSSRGIVIDEFPNKYYSKRFLHAGRIPQLESLIKTSAIQEGY
jgi:hypothetical protein